MKLFRFIRRHTRSDWLEVIRAETLKEALTYYTFSDNKNIEAEEMPERKGVILALHLTSGQAR